MSRGKIIVIEGTDCSGKETQSKMLIDRLNNEGKQTHYLCYPAYDTPTGRIVGLSYLGKPYIAEELIMDTKEEVVNKLAMDGENVDEATLDKVLKAVSWAFGKGWFPEGAPKVPGEIASLYYIADRAYNKHKVDEIIDKGEHVVLDRYVYSNLAHQGCKKATEAERIAEYERLYDLEFNQMHLNEADVKIFLHMPTEYAALLKAGRAEAADEHEKDEAYLKNAENSYVEVANRYGFVTIECIKNPEGPVARENIKTYDEINEELYGIVKEIMEQKK